MILLFLSNVVIRATANVMVSQIMSTVVLVGTVVYNSILSLREVSDEIFLTSRYSTVS